MDELEALMAALRSVRSSTACEASDAVILRVGDPAARVEQNGKARDLRWAVLAVINETARHAGHADIIRGQIDGRTGR